MLCVSRYCYIITSAPDAINHLFYLYMSLTNLKEEDQMNNRSLNQNYKCTKLELKLLLHIAVIFDNYQY